MTVRVERDGQVTTVILDRPAVRNAVNGTTAAALAEAFRKFDADSSANVAVLWGAGGTFCAGADLKARPGRCDAGRRGVAGGNPPVPRGRRPGWKARLIPLCKSLFIHNEWLPRNVSRSVLGGVLGATGACFLAGLVVTTGLRGARISFRIMASGAGGVIVARGAGGVITARGAGGVIMARGAGGVIMARGAGGVITARGAGGVRPQQMSAGRQ
jgi:hypothetical protein